MKELSNAKRNDIIKSMKRTLRHHLSSGLQNNNIFRLMFNEFKSWHICQNNDITIHEIAKHWQEFWSLNEVGYVFEHYATWYTQDNYCEENEEWIIILIDMCCVFEYELGEKYKEVCYSSDDITIYVEGKILKKFENYY